MQSPVFQTASALVVEGGAMRGIFAAGVLDAFMQAGFQPFDFAIGVSAGATNLTAYATGQAGRSHAAITRIATRREFFNPLRGLSGGHLTDVDWLWNYAHSEIPLQTHKLSAALPLYATVTRVSDQQPAYLRVTPNNVHALMVATCALPFAFRKSVVLDEVRYVDGGVSDSIPVRKAWDMGARDIVVILSQPLGYRKSESSDDTLSFTQRLLQKTFSRVLGEDEALWQAMQLRGKQYNASLDFIAQPPAGCRVHVIAPPAGFAVDRMTMNQDKLAAGYRMGTEAGTAFMASFGIQLPEQVA